MTSDEDPRATTLAELDAEAVINSSAFCAMVHATRTLTHQISPGLAALGLNPVLFLVLGQLVAAPGCTPAALGRLCGLSPQHVAAVVRGAEDRGLVERSGERGRGRPTRLALTAAGLELLVAGWPVVNGAGAGRLSDQQRRQLLTLLNLLRGTTTTDPDDVVVLVDDEGRDAGTRPRLGVHTTDTPLHRAFSLYLRDPDGRVLLTRRALTKATWPGVWSNAACGHLRPGETPDQAALRRVPEELGVTPTHLRIVLPDFRYRAVDASGLVEHELCPVMVGEVDPDHLAPDPAEVAETTWVSWDDLRQSARRTPALLSPWSVLQIDELGGAPWN